MAVSPVPRVLPDGRGSQERAAAEEPDVPLTRQQRRQQIEQQRSRDELIIGSAAVTMTTLAALCFTVWRDPIEDWVADSPLMLLGDGSELGLGDFFGGTLWGLALYFTSPVQLLLLFIGKIDIERPSDWLQRKIGLLAGLHTEDAAWEAATPPWVKAASAAICLAAGMTVAVAFERGLGDPTWSIATGLGSLASAGIFEAGRPSRLSVDEALQLEGQWKVFARFADARLQRSGRCHESEVFQAFRKEHAAYRREEALPNHVLRDMIRNWAPDADRTPSGYYKNLSVIQRLDPFTLEASGTPRQQQRQPPQQEQQQQQQQQQQQEQQQQERQQQEQPVEQTANFP